MVDEGKRLNETDAGQILQEELLEAEAQHTKALEDLRSALRDEHNESVRQVIQEEAVKLEAHIQRHQEERQGLERTYEARLNQAAADNQRLQEMNQRLQELLEDDDDDDDPFFDFLGAVISGLCFALF